jgi:hypothetical protein
MKMTLLAGLLASCLAPAFGQTVMGLKPFPPLAPLPAFTPVAQLTTQALAQKDLDKNNALLAALQQEYDDADSRGQVLGPKLEALNDTLNRLQAFKKLSKEMAAADIAGSIASGNIAGVLGASSYPNMDAAINAVSQTRLQVGFLLGPLPDRTNTLRSQMGAVKAQINVDQGALLSIAHGLPVVPPAAPKPVVPPATAVVPPAIKTATAQIDTQIKSGLAAIKSVTRPALFGQPKPNPSADTLANSQSSDEQQISDLGTQYTGAINSAPTPAAQTAAISAFNAALTALMNKQMTAVSSLVGAGVAFARSN